MKRIVNFKTMTLTGVWIWFILFALLPFLLITFTSFMQHSQEQLVIYKFTLSNYKTLFSPLYFRVFEKSFYIAFLVTLICLLIGYPFAYLLARKCQRFKHLLLILVIIPFWTSSLIRSYAMMAILKAKGLLNSLLIAIGLIHLPFEILYTNTAVLIGLVYNLLPFMILPLFANIERLEQAYIEAARDLGASKTRTFFKIIFPLTMPGVMAGCILVFLPAMTLFYIPDILGGAKSMLLGNLIQNQFLFANDWPLGAAISVILTIIMALLLWFYWRNTSANERSQLV